MTISLQSVRCSKPHSLSGTLSVCFAILLTLCHTCCIWPTVPKALATPTCSDAHMSPAGSKAIEIHTWHTLWIHTPNTIWGWRLIKEIWYICYPPTIMCMLLELRHVLRPRVSLPVSQKQNTGDNSQSQQSINRYHDPPTNSAWN